MTITEELSYDVEVEAGSFAAAEEAALIAAQETTDKINQACSELVPNNYLTDHCTGVTAIFK